MGQEFADFLNGDGAPRRGIANPLVDGSEGFVVLVVEEGGRIVQIELIQVGPTLTVDRIGVGRKRNPRVIFNEITKKAIEKVFEKPGQVNANLVDAQQARRVLDRLVTICSAGSAASPS